MRTAPTVRPPPCTERGPGVDLSPATFRDVGQPWTRRVVCVWVVLVLAVGVVLAPTAAGAATGAHNPLEPVPPIPDYLAACAPAGVDRSPVCLRLTLAAIDAAHAREGLAPMRIPSDFGLLSVPEELFVAVDAERVARGLTPLVGMAAALDEADQSAAIRATLPATPGGAYRRVDKEWIGDTDNGLDAVYQWMYDDGPGDGVPHCTSRHKAGCWIDREILLDTFAGARPRVMGAGYVTSSNRNHGGSSLSATFAVATHRVGLTYTWADALASTRAGQLQPLGRVPPNESATGIRDPAANVVPQPDYLDACAPRGIDSSARCVDAVLAAVNHAHALEGIPPMVLPTDFTQLSVPEQIFVAVDLERVERGLSPFVGLTAALDANAQKGADSANDPPDVGSGYLLVDGEWAGGSANGLDADYGWMYDDGFDSGNLDCVARGAPGCWGHRHGILDNFGSGVDLVMGAALDPTGDTNKGDVGGTSMAATLAVADSANQNLVFTWSEVLADMPPPASG